jgi:hypothetical protein
MAKGAPATLHGYGKIKTSTLPGKSGAHEKDTGAEPWKLKSRTPHVKPTCGAPTFDFLKSKKNCACDGRPKSHSWCEIFWVGRLFRQEWLRYVCQCLAGMLHWGRAAKIWVSGLAAACFWASPRD